MIPYRGPVPCSIERKRMYQGQRDANRFWQELSAQKPSNPVPVQPGEDLTAGLPGPWNELPPPNPNEPSK